MASEKKIFEVFATIIKSAGDNKHRGVDNLDPRGMIGRIYVGDHLMLLHPKYVTSGLYGFREEDYFKFFPF